jgi:hypothetical protein
MKEWTRTLSFLLLVTLVAIFGWVETASAHPLSQLYSEDVLSRDASTYQEYIYTRVVNPILNKLRGDAYRRSKKAVVVFPPYDPAQTFPLGFFTRRNAMYKGQRTDLVVVPLVSVRFVEDLCIAATWLEHNGYSLETIFNYVTMIKYRDARDFKYGRYPLPLETLGVPGNAERSEFIQKNAIKCFGSTLAFVIAHEYGHIVHAHPGYDGRIPRFKIQNNESEADAFALRMMRKMNLPPFGAVIYFLAAAYVSPMPVDFGSQEAWEIHVRKDATHPFTPDRMDALADLFESDARELAGMEQDPLAKMRMREAANRIRGIADTLRDWDLQLLIRQRGMWADEQSLRPQTWEASENLEGAFLDKTKNTELGVAVDGIYVGRFTTHGATNPSNISTNLRTTGDQVNGTYNYGSGSGTLDGTIHGNTLHLKWKEGLYYGRATFEVDYRGKEIHGSWGYKASDRDGGKWNGIRE